MSSSYGENLKISVFGESHSPGIGVVIEGIPAGEKIDSERLAAFLRRRAPGGAVYATPRSEKDVPEFLSGLRGERTAGTPICAVIRNMDVRSGDYAELKTKPRPGHADFTANVKYAGFQAFEGGGHFSGRLTAPLAVAGGICLQLLSRMGISVFSRIASVGRVRDEGELTSSVADKAFPTVSDERGKEMLSAIEEAKKAGDSIGGVVECKITGLPVGLGDPIFGGMENRISAAVFGIPAVKGIEFGAGFGASEMTGSENNDAFCIREGKVETETNFSGGILGGISDGMPIVFRVAFKPTPSIGKKQKTVDLEKMEETDLIVKGRHDPCIVPRALPAVEAAAAIAVYDAFLGRKKETRCEERDK